MKERERDNFSECRVKKIPHAYMQELRRFAESRGISVSEAARLCFLSGIDVLTCQKQAADVR